ARRRRAPAALAWLTNSTILRRSVALVIFPRPPRSPGLFFAAPAMPLFQPRRRPCGAALALAPECVCVRPWSLLIAVRRLGQTDHCAVHNWRASEESAQDIDSGDGSTRTALLRSTQRFPAPH